MQGKSCQHIGKVVHMVVLFCLLITSQIMYVNMHYNYMNMQPIYANMQHCYVDMYHNLHASHIFI